MGSLSWDHRVMLYFITYSLSLPLGKRRSVVSGDRAWRDLYTYAPLTARRCTHSLIFFPNTFTLFFAALPCYIYACLLQNATYWMSIIIHEYPAFFFDTLLSLAFVSFTLDTFCIFSNKLSHHQDYYDHEPFFIPLIKNYYY